MKMHDKDCETDALEKLVVYHPKTQYWQQLLYTMFNSVKSSTNLLQTYRLADDVGVLKQPHEITDFAELAILAGSPGEAEQVIQKALQANIYTDAQSKSKAERILRDAQKQATKDQASLPRLAREATASSNGNQLVGLGLAYYGYQQYDKAVSALQQGISKGGLKAPAEAHLLLGISEFKAGDKSAALKAFQAVKGDPTLRRLATLWSLRARQTTA
jgi:tetratricopeptide (TPR) repeat protein